MATIPSLALIPSGYKGGSPGTLYSVLPTDGTGDFDFTRSGNATRVNSEGLIELVTTNVPRLNYPLIDGVVSGCPSLLLEPQRTNLIQYSEDFSQGYWTKDGSSVTSGFTSPDGTANAFKMTEDSATSVHKISNNSAIANSFQSQSIFIKYDSSQQFIQTTSSRSINNYVNFDILNKTLTNYGTSVGKIVELSSGWLRLEVYHDSSTTAYWHFITSLTASWSESYLGTGKHLLIFGAQVEAGSYPTSYIPNFGTALGATRSAETCNNAGDVNTFNDSEGVLFAEISALSDDGTNRQIAISNGTTSQRNYIGYRISTNQVIGGSVNTSEVFLNYTLSDSKDFSKIAFKYKQNDLALWVNGFEVKTSASANVPTGLDRLNFNDGSGNTNFYGNTKQIQYFNTALNDSDLETLTSWDSFSDMAIGQLYTIE
jgi:hypothetical protein